MVDFDHVLDDRPDQLRAGERVDLADRGVRGAVDVGQEADDRNTVQEGFADARHRVGEAGTGDHAEDADMTSGARRGVGHHARGGFIGHEQVGNLPRLHRVPKLVVLSARNAENAPNPFAAERRRGRLSAGHAPLNAGALDIRTKFHAAGLNVAHVRGQRGGGRGQPQRSEGREGFSPIKVRDHFPPLPGKTSRELRAKPEDPRPADAAPCASTLAQGCIGLVASRGSSRSARSRPRSPYNPLIRQGFTPVGNEEVASAHPTNGLPLRSLFNASPQATLATPCGSTWERHGNVECIQA